MTLQQWKQLARQLKTEVYALMFAYRDPRVPWYARLWTACVVAYALSPIDLIPDPIPILGYLDDLLLLPLGVLLARKMIPPAIMAESRLRAQARVAAEKPTSWLAAMVILGIWLLLGALLVWLMSS